MAIIFTVIIAAFSLAGAGNHAKSVTEAKIAGKLAYDVIDHVPSIDPNASGKKSVDSNSHKGRI